MSAFFYFIVALGLVSCASAQSGSVHCGVGCACSEFELPVCGSDGHTYINECALRCKQCEFPHLTLLSEGECHAERPMTYQYAPAPVEYTYVAKPTYNYSPVPVQYSYVPKPTYNYAPVPVQYSYEPKPTYDYRYIAAPVHYEKPVYYYKEH